MPFGRNLIAAAALLASLAACGGEKQASAPAAAATTPTPRSAATPDVPPPPPEHPLAIGSQDAKDDLYCAGVIFAANPTPDSALNPTDQAVLEKNQMLGVALAESGVNKLMDQKVAHATHSSMISNAYADKAADDIKAGKPRIKLKTCVARARALPPPPQ
jgi:hypothetical protein